MTADSRGAARRNERAATNAPHERAMELPPVILAGCAALGLALVHLLAGTLRFLDVVPRSRWLSFGSGVSVAYVFVHLLPELAKGQQAVAGAAGRAGGALRFLEHHVYLVALLGMSAFYGLELLARRSRRSERGGNEAGVATPGVFWIHVATFALYNALIGYLLLHRDEAGSRALATFAAAMAMHFLVNDHGLRHHYKARYDRYGRWILAGMILAGWGVGAFAELPDAAVAVFFALLAGGVIFNVLKEELPEDRRSRFSAFALGAAGYAALLLAI